MFLDRQMTTGQSLFKLHQRNWAKTYAQCVINTYSLINLRGNLGFPKMNRVSIEFYYFVIRWIQNRFLVDEWVFSVRFAILSKDARETREKTFGSTKIFHQFPDEFGSHLAFSFLLFFSFFFFFFSQSRPEARLYSCISTQLFLQSRPLHENSQEILMMQCHAIKRGLWSPTRRTCLRPSIYNSWSKIKFTGRGKCELSRSKEKKEREKRKGINCCKRKCWNVEFSEERKIFGKEKVRSSTIPRVFIKLAGKRKKFFLHLLDFYIS